MDIKGTLENPGPKVIAVIITAFILAGAVAGAGFMWGTIRIAAISAG